MKKKLPKLMGKGGVYASDHLPVWADFKVD